MNLLLHPVPLALPLVIAALCFLAVREYLLMCEINRTLRRELESACERENLRNYEPMSRSATVMPLRPVAEDACEGGCAAPVAGYDSEGVPLCKECLEELERSRSNNPAQPRRDAYTQSHE